MVHLTYICVLKELVKQVMIKNLLDLCYLTGCIKNVHNNITRNEFTFNILKLNIVTLF